MTTLPKSARGFLSAAFLGSTMLVSGTACSYPAPAAADNSMTAMQQLQLLGTVLELTRQAYVDPAKANNHKKVMENALKGALEGLDPNSTYLSAEEFKELQTEASGEFVGIGAELGLTPEKIVQIIAPIEGSPAEAAGVKAKDIIIEIDGKSTRGMNLNDAVKLIRGEKETPVKLKLIRAGEDKPVDVTIIRNTIKTLAVKTAVIGNDIGYIQLTTFHKDGVARQFREAVQALEANTNGTLKSYVLNLRNNPGGYLADSAKIADDMIDSNNFITYIRGNQKEENKVCDKRRGGEDYCATPGDLLKGKEIVVLVNGGSASASEVVAGALQDYKRATILGTQTYGKGSVQSIIPLDRYIPELAGAAVKLTTALYFTPLGRSIQGIGITPDILFKPLDNADQRAFPRAADDANAIANPNGTTQSAKSVATCTPKPDAEKEKSLEKVFFDRAGKVDYELLCAVETLRKTPQLTVTTPNP